VGVPLRSEIFVKEFLGEARRPQRCPDQDEIAWMVGDGRAFFVVALFLLLSVRLCEGGQADCILRLERGFGLGMSVEGLCQCKEKVYRW
ncbi:MAG: hypothetical protein PV344_00430, partial [Anaplasma sp.]|nr:hypothetical protein [Anaplasma sp.]